MFNKLFKFTQEKTGVLYENSLILKNIDNLIFLAIGSVFVLSTFMSSDTIGFAALVVAMLTFVKLLTTPGAKISCRGFEFWLLVYFMLIVISLFGSTLFYYSFKGFTKTLTYLLFYCSTVIYLKDNREKIPFFMGLIGFCLTSQAIVGFLQNFSHVSEISTWQDVSNLNPEQVMTRVYGTLKPFNPNLLGGYLVVGLPSLFAMTATRFYEKRIYGGLIWLCLAVFTIITIFLTGCRGAYLATFTGMVLAFGISAKFFWNTYKKLYMGLMGGFISIITSALIMVSSLRARIFSIFAMRADSSNSFRFNVYNSSIQMFKDNWLLGIGLGNQNFREIYGLYMRTGFDALSAYNIFLETAVESGVFALIAFLGFFVSVIKDSLKFIFNSNNTRNIIFVFAAFISFVSVMVHGLVDTVFFRPQLQFIFWFMVSILSVFLNKK
ncbi:O-antigen ligase family protein [bacterium]|nr:O-antigen ligase family protein [bacterium]